MGKKCRKTRWRTLTIAGDRSDSEDSNTTTTSGHRVSKGLSQKSYYSRFPYSSQSTPTRRYQCDGTKSTRSSSTASENKITFNEDEYTRITTPRQDVLFKKGYLNKPKTYQTQTSTGTSTASTGNSTDNGTPDHQSTDLEYESQFIFPNGFVDQNGVYYINSFEPYPVMVYNPPTYYPEVSNVTSKRCSTGSLTESTSPNNEEASQDLSQGETPGNIPEFSHVYNVIYPGFYFGGACQPQETASQPEPRRLKKKKRRRPSRSKATEDGTTSDYTDESSDEVFKPHDEEIEKPPAEVPDPTPKEDAQEAPHSEDAVEPSDLTPDVTEEKEVETPTEVDEASSNSKYDLKPDAEEFVPRGYQQSEVIPLEQGIQFVKMPPNFLPLPVLNPISDFNGHGFNAFIPPAFPINFIPQNYVNFIPNVINKEHPPQTTTTPTETKSEGDGAEVVEVPKSQIDIAKIVSKLEEAAKDQNDTISQKTVDKSDAETRSSPSRRTSNLERRNKRNRYSKVSPSHTKTITPTETTKLAWKPKSEASPVASKPYVRNYSDTVKKSHTISFNANQSYSKLAGKQQSNKSVSTQVHERKPIPNFKQRPAAATTDEWISVSNKRKKKIKNLEEIEDQDEQKVVELHDEKVVPAEEHCTPVEPVVPLHETPFAVSEVIAETVINDIASPEILLPVNEVIAETVSNEITSEPAEKVLTKKKPRKVPKNVSKRVMVEDLNFLLKTEAQTVEEPSEPENRTIEDVKIEEPKTEVTPPSPPTEPLVQEAIVEAVAHPTEIKEKQESSDKKSKKKKKKSSKVTASNEPNTSISLNMTDDSYDFLLEPSVLNDSMDKTNVEISEELDKMIQKGMYNSLEEKIKSLNIESNDNFFKSIMHNISSRESSVEKSGYSKTQDLTGILNTTSNFFKPQSLALDSIASTSVNTNLRHFLDNGRPKPGVDDHIDMRDKAKVSTADANDNRYPITKAVKDWMMRTREATPDVELLKSPSTILKEFGADEKSKNGAGDADIDDEITLYPCDKTELRKTSSSSTEEDEDALEIYESKYGKNEDYLRIQNEIEEQRTTNCPKHGNLPYRAICCSIM